MSVLVPIPHCFDYYSFIVLSLVWEVRPPALFFFLRIALAMLDFSWFHINLRIICFSSVKNVMGNLIGIPLNLQTVLGTIATLSILIFPIQEHGICFHFFESTLISFINVL